MSPVDRREFLSWSLGSVAGLAAVPAMESTLMAGAVADEPPPAGPGPTTARSTDEDVPPPPMIDLGKTGIRMSRLGQGTGVRGWDRQSNQTRLGFARLIELFEHSYRRGIRFFDLADLYGTHIYFREALRTIPRDEVTILTKIWWRYDGPESATHRQERRDSCRSALARFRHELGTDRIDIVLLHCLTDPEWSGKMEPYVDILQKEKEAGLVRALGVSCHDFGALEAAAKAPWIDVILARINPRGEKMDAEPDKVVEVLREAKAAGKAILGMKIFGEGALVHEREMCMQFAQGLNLLDAMTIGFESTEQVDDTLRLMARFPAAASSS